MKPRKAMLALLVSAAGLSGFTDCGGSEPITLPPPPPPPPEVECTDHADEASCTADTACVAVYVSVDLPCACPECAPGSDCPPCDCAQPLAPEFVGCQDRGPCEGLDEAQCISNPSCQPAYIYGDCAEGPDGAGEDRACPAPDCGAPPPTCEPTVTYGGCFEQNACDAVACDIYCPFGHAVDPNGCEICACNPPPGPCSGLDESQCVSTPGCQPIYGGDDEPCVCEACDPNGNCTATPCSCDQTEPGLIPPPAPSDYQGCIATDPCAGLDEPSCSATPGCMPVYNGGEPCACPACEAGENCPPCECAGDGSGFRAPPPDGDDEVPQDPPANGYAYCVSVPSDCFNLDEQQCLSNPSCIAEYSECTKPDAFCDPSDPACGAPAPCPPPQFQGCRPNTVEPGCASDAECPNGYCDAVAVCDAIGCERRHGGQCVYPVCGDGSEVLCDMIPPVCAPGLTVAVRNGCFECVDARSCSTPSPYCSWDGDCPNGYCDFSGMGGGGSTGGDDPNSGGARPAPPPGQCVYPTCGDGSPLMCRALQPDCGPGYTAGIYNGCWACVNAQTCQ